MLTVTEKNTNSRNYLLGSSSLLSVPKNPTLLKKKNIYA